MVLGAPTAIVRFDRFKSPPELAMEPSRRGRVVLDRLSSSALPLSRNQPAVPAATPVNCQRSVDLETTPAEGVPQVRPLVDVPGVNAPPAFVTVPNSVPVAALSADAGCAPE